MCTLGCRWEVSMKTKQGRKTIRAGRWKRAYQLQRNLHKEILEEAHDIVKSSNFASADECIQHGNMTVKKHCLNVARYSLLFSKKIPLEINKRDLIRGALLHDYFLYDWHKKDKKNAHKNLHGFYHPGIALNNANREYKLTPRQKDIIKKHMWPLTIVPPMCKEAWIVTAADKYCSLLETLHIHRSRAVKNRHLPKRG